ncbi:hypothetical protein PoB_003813000 [Plakobranchus ocellatus]|uniref:Uncharacterized protein n=1 Tax=Plakobranchus ocellatus TaxID=259542 RepID=A0AAV4AXU2_9GAST|nr:hypothetical protein PoB_003813000 [Plakobranchus ocellatus]
MSLIFSKEVVLFPLREVFLYRRILLLEVNQLVTINSTVPLYCRHLQWSSCHTHHHRHVRILRASYSLHVPNDDITDGVRDTQHLQFIT